MLHSYMGVQHILYPMVSLVMFIVQLLSLFPAKGTVSAILQKKNFGSRLNKNSIILSDSNPKVKNLKALSQKKKRDKLGLITLEGCFLLASTK